MKNHIENAIYEAAPEVTAVVADSMLPATADSAFVILQTS